MPTYDIIKKLREHAKKNPDSIESLTMRTAADRLEFYEDEIIPRMKAIRTALLIETGGNG